MESFEKRPLEGVANILDSQDNGYKNTVSAISELIDNSIQANASKIDIVLINTRRKSQGSAQTRLLVNDIYIIDDGEGMSKEAFASALQISAGTRSGATKGLGKYGQGLPQASRSQTTCTELYSKTSNIDYWFYDRMDLNEIYKSGNAELSCAKSIKAIEDEFLLKSYSDKLYGTIVKWKDVNRVKPKTSGFLIAHAIPQLGRTFRYFLSGKAFENKRKVQINIKTFNYDEKLNSYRADKKQTLSIAPYDPLFLSSSGQFVTSFPKNKHPTSYQYSEVKETVEFYSRDEKKIKAEIAIIFSLVKKEERFLHGRNAGSTPFGKEYLFRGLKEVHRSGYANISVLREFREIDTGSFGFIGDISDNRHRWWSVEVHIPPSMDHVFGVGNKKQHAHKFGFITADDIELDHNELVVKQVSNTISSNLTSILEELKKQAPSRTTGGGGNGLPEGVDTEAGSPVDEDKETNVDVDETILWLKQHRKRDDIPDEKLREIVEFALSTPDKHIFLEVDLGPIVLFEHKVVGDKVLIELNQSHRLFRSFIKRYEDDTKVMRTIRVMIGAFVNSLIKSNDKSAEYKRHSNKISTGFATSLEDYLDVLYPNDL